MLLPHHQQDREGDSEHRQAAHHLEQLVEVRRHLQRHDQQGDGEAEHGVAERFDARDVVSGDGGHGGRF
jgi:hypothetical protein